MTLPVFGHVKHHMYHNLFVPYPKSRTLSRFSKPPKTFDYIAHVAFLDTLASLRWSNHLKKRSSHSKIGNSRLSLNPLSRINTIFQLCSEISQPLPLSPFGMQSPLSVTWSQCNPKKIASFIWIFLDPYLRRLISCPPLHEKLSWAATSFKESATHLLKISPKSAWRNPFLIPLLEHLFKHPLRIFLSTEKEKILLSLKFEATAVDELSDKFLKEMYPPLFASAGTSVELFRQLVMTSLSHLQSLFTAELPWNDGGGTASLTISGFCLYHPLWL